MREKLLTTALLVLFLLNSTAGNPRYTALNFGNHHTNYILFKPDMEPLSREFTVCSWIKSFLEYDNVSTHTWLSYATEDHFNEFLAGDSGRSILFNKYHMSFSPHFTELWGKRAWYHYCISANFYSRTLKFYLNGNKIGEALTPEKRYLGLGGYLALGGDQDSHGGGFAYADRFGGELFKLNFFSEQLNSSEILEMSKNMCGEIEETYGEIRHIKWDEIVQERDYRYGQIIEKTECEEDCRDHLNETAEELDKVKKEKVVLETRLQEKDEQLSKMIQHLNQSTENWNRLLMKLEETKENSSKLLNESRIEHERISKAKDDRLRESQKMVKKLGMEKILPYFQMI